MKSFVLSLIVLLPTLIASVASSLHPASAPAAPEEEPVILSPARRGVAPGTSGAADKTVAGAGRFGRMRGRHEPAARTGPGAAPLSRPARDRLTLTDAWRRIRGDEGTDPKIWEGFGQRELRSAISRFPATETAASFREYAEIRGGRYFADWKLREYGDAKYDPDREIPGFIAWIARYPGHPGQDDASYRLGRCYGILGDRISALYWFERARRVPDGDMGEQADCWANLLRDALMTEDELLTFYLAEESAEAAYALGLRRFRAGDEDGAVMWMARAISGLPPWLGEQVGRQIRQVKQIESLTRAVRAAEPGAHLAEALYALGRRQYHAPRLYSSVLWEGWRGYRLWGAGILQAFRAEGVPDSYRDAYRSMDSQRHARRAFLRLAEECPSSSLVEKARFSAVNTILRGARSRWNPELRVLEDWRKLRTKASEEYRTFARDYPFSTLADDALFLAGDLSADREAFREVVRRCPQGDYYDRAAARASRDY